MVSDLVNIGLKITFTFKLILRHAIANFLTFHIIIAAIWSYFCVTIFFIFWSLFFVFITWFLWAINLIFIYFFIFIIILNTFLSWRSCCWWRWCTFFFCFTFSSFFTYKQIFPINTLSTFKNFYVTRIQITLASLFASFWFRLFFRWNIWWFFTNNFYLATSMLTWTT